MIPYPKFYKATGVRLGRQLRSPKLNLIREFAFPKGSYFHYTQQDTNRDDIQLGIEEDNIFLANLDKSARICVFHNTDYDPSLDIRKDRWVKQNIQKPLLVKNYHREHPNFVKGFIDTGKANIVTNLCVKNHVLVGADYSYVKTVLSDYTRNRNYWKSVFLDIGRTVLRDNRQHFVAIPLPSIIPSRSQLNKWETESKTVHARLFAAEERFLFAEFYAWLKGDTDSVFPLEPKVMERLNIIFHYKSVYYVVNLHELYKYIIPEVGKTEPDQVFDQDTIRKFFLLGAVNAVMDRGVAGTMVDTDEGEAIEQNDDDEQQDELDDDTEDNSVDTNDDDVTRSPLEINEAGLFESKRTNLMNSGNGQIKTIEELLKIGGDRGFIEDKKKSRKELRNDDAKIFNTEETQAQSDEEALELLEEVNGAVEVEVEKTEILKAVGYNKYEAEDLDLSSHVIKRVDKLALNGRHSSGELNRLKRIASKWEDISDPYGSGKKAPEIIDIKPTDIIVDRQKKLVDVKVGGVLDESMMYSSLDDINKKYTSEVLHRHMLSSAVNLQRADVCVTDYKLTRVENAFDGFEVHSFKLVPLEGEESTIKVKIPIVDEDGSFMASGVKSRMRTQRIDLPIRKISNYQVALTSYVSKFFVNRSEKAAYSQERWMEKQLIGLSNERPDVLINFADVFKPDLVAPLKFTMLSRIVSKIEIGNHQFNFDAEKMNSIYGKDLVDEMNQANKVQVIVGKNKVQNKILVMAKDGTIFEASTEKKGDIVELGSIESILGFSIEKAPLDMIEVQGYGDLPIVFILSYFLGFGNLLKTIDAKFERHPKGTRLRKLEDYEYTIRFSDEYLIFDRRDYRTQLIVAGWKQIAETIKHYSVYQFDSKEVFGSVLLDLKKSARILKTLDVIRDLWIDPITRDILRSMNEPTDFVELLFSAVNKLVSDHHDVTRDERGFRQRGYERFAGFAYAEMVAAVIQHNAKPSKNNAKIEINPQAVWMKILQDKTTSPVEDSNPIHALKEQEVLVYRGTGGRDGRTLNSEARKYHPNSIGIISDATVDNGDAGSVMYTTANPNYVNLLGMTEVIPEKDRKDIPATQLLSTSSLLAPAIEFDD